MSRGYKHMAFFKICPKCKKRVGYEIDCCADIYKKEELARYKRYSATRTDKEHMKQYNTKKWKVTRADVKKRDKGLCQLCLHNKKIKAIDLVHHIVESKDDNSLFYVMSNLISLCSDCHSNVHDVYKECNLSKVKLINKLNSLIEN